MKGDTTPVKLLVSACLLGCPCRYDGQAKPCPAVLALRTKHTLIPFCPEIYGGLPTPRPPAEMLENRLVTRDGRDVTHEYRRGAEIALSVYETLGCDGAVLKAKSPSCGIDMIYDGSFTGTLRNGDGVTAALFRAHGIPVIREDEIEQMDALFPEEHNSHTV